MIGNSILLINERGIKQGTSLYLAFLLDKNFAKHKAFETLAIQENNPLT